LYQKPPFGKKVYSQGRGGLHRVIYNGVPEVPESSNTASSAGEIGIKGEYILALGRLSPEKGLDFLMKVYASLALAYPNLSLVLAEDGPEKGRLKGLSEALGIKRGAHFTGYLVRPQALLVRAHLLGMPSLPEGLPITLLEAMRVGFDIVASEVGEIPKVTGSVKAACFVLPGQVNVLTEALTLALASPTGHWGCKAQELFKKEFTVLIMARDY